MISENSTLKIDMAYTMLKALTHVYGNRVYLEVCDYESGEENKYMIAIFPEKGRREKTIYYKVDGSISE